MGLYPNLPGYTTTISDGSLKFTSQTPQTDNIVLLGSAIKGPLYEVVSPKSLSEAIDVFGIPSTDASLVLGFERALDAGCQDVKLMVLNLGTQAQATLVDSLDADLAVVKSKGRGPHLNGVIIKVEDDKLIITGENMEGELSFDLKEDDAFITLEDFATAVNESNDLIEIEVETGKEEATTDELGTGDIGELAGGSFTFDVAQLKQELDKAYNILVDMEIDFVVPIDGRVTESDKTVAQQLADFCAKASQNNRLTLGVISAREKDDEETLAEYKTALMQIDNAYEYTIGQTVVDAGKFIHISIGQSDFKSGSVDYDDVNAVSFAGLVSSLPAKSSPTNKRVQGAKKSLYTFSASQLNDLTGKKFITFRSKPGRGIVVTDGVNCAKDDSVFGRTTTIRIVASAIKAVKDASDPFIGEPSNIVQRNSLNTAIKYGLDTLMELGYIQNFSFNIRSTPTEMAKGIFNVDLEIVPVFELRKIKTTVTLRPEL